MDSAESEPESNGEPMQSHDAVKGDKPWQFKKGQSGNPGGKPKCSPVPAGPRSPRLLRDMRMVFKQGASKDRTPAQKALRKVLNDNPADFISQLTGLEKAYLSAVGKAPKVRAPATPPQPLTASETEPLCPTCGGSGRFTPSPPDHVETMIEDLLRELDASDQEISKSKAHG